nr:helix-turn-helix transcriptional regulator [uncultured Devosia sp.]
MDDNEWMRSEMDVLRISQREVADVLNIDPSGVSRLVGGKRKPTNSERERLLRLFDRVRSSQETRNGLPELGPLEHALLVANVDAASLSEASGIPLERILGYLGVDGRVPNDEAETIGKILGVRPGLLTGGERHEQYRSSRVRHAPRANDRVAGVPVGENLPVYAAPILQNGRLQCDFEMVEMRAPPPELVHASSAFGLYIGDGDHGGRFRRGDIAWVVGKRPVRVGDDVLAVLAPVIWLGQLESMDDEEYVIRIGGQVERVTRHAELFRVAAIALG